MEINETDFLFVREILLKQAAIVIENGKEYLVKARLVPLVKSEGLESISDLVQRIRTTNDRVLTKRIVEALTTNETTFFRDLEPFHLLRDKVIPEILLNRKEKKELHIWSAACSTGQEPYSIAMLLRETFPQLREWNVKIYATDLSSQVLDRAREGIFSQFEVNRGLPAQYLIKYFSKDGQNWRLKQELRDWIRFFEMNLMIPFHGIPRVDVIFVRNVLIYFSLEMKRDILGRMKSLLQPDGALFLGSAETTVNIDHGFERVASGVTSYYKVKQA